MRLRVRATFWMIAIVRGSFGRSSEACLRRISRRMPISVSAQSFVDSELALQDVVNEMGSRLGAEVEPGALPWSAKHVGFDGLWRFSNGHSLPPEVKTTDAYRIDLNTIAEYRKAFIGTENIAEKASSMLLIVGRQDTGDLEARIRGSRHAWDIQHHQC